MKIKVILNYLMSVCMVLNACHNSSTQTELCIQKGNFKATLTETGELQAVNARSVLVPYVGWKYGWQYKITGLVEHGSHVVAGDSVAQLDPSNVMKFLLEKETLLETEKANLNKLLVEQENKQKELEASFKEVQADYNLKKLELQKFEYESTRKKEIKELEFQQAIINLDKVKRSIELEKSIRLNALKIQKIKVSQLENDIKEASKALIN
jgi:HlyD family secretion protein